MSASSGRRPSPGHGGLSPESQVDPWKEPHVQVVNTFLTMAPPLSETATGFLEMRRQISDPTSSRSSSLSSSQSKSLDKKGAAPPSVRRKAGLAAKSSRDRAPGGSDAESTRSKGSAGSSKGADQRRGEAGEAPAEDPAHESAGSALHASGKCRPCAFFQKESGCALGKDCNFCHMFHELSGKIRLRPCKGKRMRTKKMFDRLGKQVAKDPEGFDLAALDLPPSLETNATLKSRLIDHLQECADQARAGRSSASEGEGGPPAGIRPRGRGSG